MLITDTLKPTIKITLSENNSPDLLLGFQYKLFSLISVIKQTEKEKKEKKSDGKSFHIDIVIVWTTYKTHDN